jgi:uncharacterized HAD superfamily protein
MSVRVSIDLDGCVYPWQEVCYEHLRDTMDLQDSYDVFWSETVNAYNELWLQNIIRIPFLYEKRSIEPMVLGTLDELARKYEIYYITSRPKDVTYVTERWVRKNKLPYYNNLILTDNKKVAVVELEIDYHVDDLPKHLFTLRGFTELFMVRQPWNSYLSDEFLTIHNVPELSTYLL